MHHVPQPAPEQLEVVFANANVAHPGVMWRHSVATVAEVGRYAAQAGYDGVEWMPLWPMQWTQGQITDAVLAKELIVSSLHAGFADKHPQEAPEPNGSLAARVYASPLGRLATVSARGSLQWMRRLQARLQREPGTPHLDEVHYPILHGPDYESPQASAHAFNAGRHHQRLMAQPTDWLAAATQSRNPAELAQVLVAHGYDAVYPFVLDTHHVRRSGVHVPRAISNLPQTLPGIAANTGEVHVSLVRYDTSDNMDKDAMRREAVRVMSANGCIDGVLGAMLAAAFDLGDVRRVVVEARVQDIEAASGSTRPEFIKSVYQNIAANIRGFYATTNRR